MCSCAASLGRQPLLQSVVLGCLEGEHRGALQALACASVQVAVQVALPVASQVRPQVPAQVVAPVAVQVVVRVVGQAPVPVRVRIPSTCKSNSDLRQLPSYLLCQKLDARNSLLSKSNLRFKNFGKNDFPNQNLEIRISICHQSYQVLYSTDITVRGH